VSNRHRWPRDRSTFADADALRLLEHRLGQQHAMRRLRAENRHEARMQERYLSFARWESLLTPIAIELILKLVGLYEHGRANAEGVEVRRHFVQSKQIPLAFDGFVILQISDLHCDISGGAMAQLAELLDTLRYDICVLTGDYRGATFGSCHATLVALEALRPRLRGAVYGVLGNHDPTRMVIDLEKMKIRMLMNESDSIERDGQHIHIAGIDDAHFYRTHSVEAAAAAIPREAFSILLSHTPEVYHQAAHAGFNLLLSGHTHGGQICLPKGVALALKSKVPRRLGSGPWRHLAMQGYTSAGVGSSALPIRFNCPPEITLHHLQKTAASSEHD
jgi:uncharacterized protein